MVGRDMETGSSLADVFAGIGGTWRAWFTLAVG
jgi:hypothetical protein